MEFVDDVGEDVGGEVEDEVGLVTEVLKVLVVEADVVEVS